MSSSLQGASPGALPRCRAALGGRISSLRAPGRSQARRSCRAAPPAVSASAAAPAAAAAVADEWVQATGVPLLRQLSGASTLQEVLVGGGQALLLTCVAAVVGRKILQWVDQHLRSIPPSTDSGAAGQAFRALVSSALHQASVLLPWGAAAFGATIVCAVLQLAAERRADVLADLFTARTAAAVASSLRFLTQFLQDAAEEVAVLLCTFTLLEFRTRVVQHVQGLMLQGDCDKTNSDAAGLVAALGSAAGVLIWVGTCFVTLANYGVNLRPILASLGASSLVVGMCVQHLLRNLAAGITLYATRPFSLGDKIILRAGGMVAVAGTVAALHPTRTIIASEQETGASSAIFVNNSEIVESYIIENLSRAAPSTAAYEPSADGTLAL